MPPCKAKRSVSAYVSKQILPFDFAHQSIVQCSAKPERQSLLTLQVSRYCIWLCTAEYMSLEAEKLINRKLPQLFRSIITVADIDDLAFIRHWSCL